MKEVEYTGDFAVLGKMSYQVSQSFINKYIFAARFVADKVVLDVACGTGYGSSHLKERGARVVTDGDISEDAIGYAKTHYVREGLSFVRLDATKTLPFRKDFFDVIVSLDTIEHLKDYRGFLFECRRVLKEGGLFICATPNSKGTLQLPLLGRLSPPVHVHEFGIDEFRNLMEEYFVNLTLYAHTKLTLKLKVGYGLNVMGAKLLSSLPKGDYLERLIRKYVPRFKAANLGAGISDIPLDPKFEVFPLKDDKVGTVVAVAEKSG